MRAILNLFVEQFRSGEVWKRAWELNKFKSFNSLADWKRRVTRPFTKEEVPALIVTIMLCVGLIILLAKLFKSSDLPFAIAGAVALFHLTQKGIEAVKGRDDKNH